MSRGNRGRSLRFVQRESLPVFLFVATAGLASAGPDSCALDQVDPRAVKVTYSAVVEEAQRASRRPVPRKDALRSALDLASLEQNSRLSDVVDSLNAAAVSGSAEEGAHAQGLAALLLAKNGCSAAALLQADEAIRSANSSDAATPLAIAT